MKNKILVLLVLALLWGLSLDAQSAREKRIERTKDAKVDKILDTEDVMFKDLEVPEKWKDKSVVMLAQKVNYQYGIKHPGDYKGNIRKMLKLQDKAAVAAFSSLTFYNAENSTTGVRIIKGDGTIIKVDMTKAVGVDEEVTRKTIFSTYERGNFKYKKIALENLEVGDILDYAFGFESNFQMLFMPECTSPMILNFQESYPIRDFRIEFSVKRGYYINSASIAGAPNLELDEVKSNNRFQYYFASRQMMEPYQDVSWVFEEVTIPSIKFQVCLPGKSIKRDEIIGELGSVKEKVSDAELHRVLLMAHNYKMSNHYASVGRVTYIRYRLQANNYLKDYVNWANRYLRNERKQDVLLNKLYYKIRHDFYFGDYSAKSAYVDDEFSATLIHAILKKIKVDAKIVVVPAKHLTTSENLVSRKEMYWLVMVKDGPETRFIKPLSKNRGIGDGFWRTAGVEGYVIDTDLKKVQDNYVVPRVRIPADSYEENQLIIARDIKIDENQYLAIKSTQKYVGQEKFTVPDYFLMANDLALEEKSFMVKSEGSNSISATERRKNKKQKEESDFNVEENKTKQFVLAEKDINRRWSIDKYNAFEVKSTGRFPQSDTLEVIHDFVAKELLTKAGNNLFLDIGKLYGDYKKIDTSTLREFPIQYDFPLRIHHTFSIEVPAGYSADGLTNLNMNYESSVGKFNARAFPSGNSIVVEVERIFLSAEMPKDNWNEFVTFQNLAYEFSQRKLLLRKN